MKNTICWELLRFFFSIWLALIKIKQKICCVSMSVFLVSFITNKLYDNEMQNLHHWLTLPATDLYLQYNDRNIEECGSVKNVMKKPMYTFPLWLKLNVTSWNVTFKAASKITVTMDKGCWEKYYYAFVHRLIATMHCWYTEQWRNRRISRVLTFSVRPFKCQVSAADGTLFNLTAHCKTVFSHLDEKDVHLMGQSCPVHTLKVDKPLEISMRSEIFIA